jgi:methylglutaconyl-CoA hydratase
MAPLTTVRREDQPGVLRITLTRPEVRNAFDEEAIAALTAIARDAAKDPTLRAMVIAGSGPSFCAGADLAWMMKAVAYSRQENLRDAEDLARLLELLDSLPVPVIARVHGAALGGGAGLVAVCDVAVAADSTVFAFTEARLGIVPAVISPYVVAKIGVSSAR